MDWTLLTVIAQLSFALWFLIGHYIPIPGLNDLRSEAYPNEKAVNRLLLLVQLINVFGFYYHIPWIMGIATLFWTVSMAGHLLSWWIPYFYGWPKGFLTNAVEDNAKTYHFLPARSNHPIPDLNHCIIGVLCLFAFITSWIALFVTR